MTLQALLQLDLVPWLTGLLAAIACALPGNFLVLRRQALLGDAISHVVLPGIVGAFLLTGQLAPLPMLLGAATAALIAVGLIEAIRIIGRVEPGAAMGAVFTGMFAGGVLMLEVSGASRVHLDVEHALMGNLSALIWFEATGWASLVDPAALAMLPRELPLMAGVATFLGLMAFLFWRPLALTTFDEGFARAIGLAPGPVGLGLVAASGLAAVAAFQAVGAILAIAMFICPPATARLMTDRLGRQVGLSLCFAASAATLGYALAAFGPMLLGHPNSVSAPGMIAVVGGLQLGLAALIGPRRKGAGQGLGRAA